MTTATVYLATLGSRRYYAPAILAFTMFVLLSLVTYVRWTQPTPHCVNDEVRYTEIVDAKVPSSRAAPSHPTNATACGVATLAVEETFDTSQT